MEVCGRHVLLGTIVWYCMCTEKSKQEFYLSTFQVCYGGDVAKSHYRKKEEFFPSHVAPQHASLHRQQSINIKFDIPAENYVIR